MGQRRANLSDLEENGQLGDWCFLENDDLHLFLRYPRTDGEPYPEGWIHRGEIVHLPISHESNVPKHWQWNGSLDSPTLTPSINVIGKWHGYLTDGKLITV
jgi:hypothetical protein